ncbi:MAG: hypothetical protein LC808_38320 [Actinobacteria bacterium]|nr:hypothetical protein [Actinomycetota bacterium]
MADGDWRRNVRGTRAMAGRIAPGVAVAVGGALLGTFTAIGLWIAVLGVALIVVGLVWGLRQSERDDRAAARRVREERGMRQSHQQRY